MFWMKYGDSNVRRNGRLVNDFVFVIGRGDSKKAWNLSDRG